jgi:hypothetical protein
VKLEWTPRTDRRQDLELEGIGDLIDMLKMGDAEKSVDAIAPG